VLTLRNKLFQYIRHVISHSDLLLLFLCLSSSVFGILMVASATTYLNQSRNVIVQLAATGIGVVLYFLFTAIDIDIISERREVLFVFSLFLIALLLTPLKVNVNGNTNWLHIPGVPFNIQPSEICKILFIILIARTMAIYQSSISRISTLLRCFFYVVTIVGFLVAASRDFGSALIFLLIFVVMLWTGGVHWGYFMLAVILCLIAIPMIWNLKLSDGTYLFSGYQRERIQVLFDTSLDPNGNGIRWQLKNSLLTLANGGVTGMGLFNGFRTQVGALPEQQTDFIFSVVGEELGIVGCILVMLMEFFIVARCIYVGTRSGNYMNRQICVGIAAMLIWQIVINIGMCVGYMPVIGLTLPFLSYGGSATISIYMSMGVVSGIYMRPAPDSSASYVRAPLDYIS